MAEINYPWWDADLNRMVRPEMVRVLDHKTKKTVDRYYNGKFFYFEGENDTGKRIYLDFEHTD